MLKELGEEETYYYHPDHLGSVSVVSNHKGEPYERVEYLPFGEMWIEETDPATGYIPFRFTSKEYDEETGLYYYGARYYEPRLSRWMSADPAGFALINPMDGDGKPRAGYSVIEAANWYSYVSNNPVKYVDPTGLLETDPAKLASSIIDIRRPGFGKLKDVTKRFERRGFKFSDDESGLNSRIFRAEDGSYVLAFQGINPVSSKDWTAAVGQAISGDTEGQFKEALELVDNLIKEGGLDSSNLMLTGSSLGGALAAYAGSQRDINTVTFNAAGVHESNIGPHADKVTNYHMRGDPLTRLQGLNSLPAAIGKQIGVSPTLGDAIANKLLRRVSPGLAAYHRHSIGTIHNAFIK